MTLFTADRERRLTALAWGAFAVLAGLNVWSVARHATPLGVPWQRSNGNLLDYRDIVVTPGRWLWTGHNPYDPSTYLAVHPWAQEFDPYAPSWLVLTSPLCWLPVWLGGGLYLMMGSVILATTSRLLARVAWPRHAALLGPLIAVWLILWYPTRTLGSSVLVSCAAAFLFLGTDRRSSPWRAGMLLSLTLMKPQIGLLLSLYLLAHREWRVVWRGWLLMVACSAPALVVCLVDSGGPLGFALGLKRDIDYANSPEAAVGLLTAASYRIDVVGMIARTTGVAPGALAQAVLVLVLIAAGVFTMWCSRRQHASIPALMAATLLVPVHMNYDLCFWPAAAAQAVSLARQYRSRITFVLAACSVAVVAHLHRITVGLLGLSRLAGDYIDVTLVLLSGLLGAAHSLRRGMDEARGR